MELKGKRKLGSQTCSARPIKQLARNRKLVFIVSLQLCNKIAGRATRACPPFSIFIARKALKRKERKRHKDTIFQRVFFIRPLVVYWRL